jgi:predicted dehydrogenase
MGSKPVRVAVIGCGRIAGHHCRSIIDSENVELIAVCDLDQDKATAYGSDFGVPAYTNYREMLSAHPEVNVVTIATPSGMHFEHALEVLEKFQKHVVVEKPTFMKPSQVTEAYKIAGIYGLKIFPVFQNRNNLAVQKVKNAIELGQLGKIRVIAVRMRWCRPQRYYDMSSWRGTFSHDGGALTNQGIHYIDVMRFLGGDILSVNASMATLGASIEVEDTVVATLTCESGALGVVEITTAARPDDFEASVSLVCEKGLAQIGGIAVNELQIFTPDPSACEEFSEDFSGNVYGNGHLQFYRHVGDDLTGKHAFPVDGEDCLKSLKLLNAFYCSDERGSWVNLEDLIESPRLGRENNLLSNLYRTPL